MRVRWIRAVDMVLGAAVVLAALGVPWGMTLAVTVFCWRLAYWLSKGGTAFAGVRRGR